MKGIGFAATAVAAAVIVGGAARADVIISGNSASFGNGPITTIDFTTNTPVGSFVPDGAMVGSANGRGLALTNNEFFYTELGGGGFGATDGIHIAPYNNGAGGHDIGFFANPAPGQGIQDLAFGKAGLYVLTGYPSSQPTVYLLNPTTGATISITPLDEPPSDPGQDGFTVLADGSFLGNTGDATNNYQHYDAAGHAIGSPFSVPGQGGCTGVDVAPDGLSLYFVCGFSTVVHTDLTGTTVLGTASISGTNEDIAVQQPFTPPPPNVPEPATLGLFGAALVGLGIARRKRA